MNVIFILTASAIMFLIVFLWTKGDAKEVARIGFFCSLLALLLIMAKVV